MNKVLHMIAPMLLLLASCSLAGSVEVVAPQVGKPMPAGSSSFGVVHKGRTLCTHWVEVAKVTYNFDVLCGSGEVVYIQVSDPQFRTQEGLAIGMPLSAALRIHGSERRKLESSCGVLLPSGWLARAEGTPGLDEKCADPVGALIAHFEKR